MALCEIIVALLVIAVVFILRYMLRYRGYIESLGIPYVKPFLIFGSPPYFWHKISVHHHSQEMHRKLGKTWAKYEGREPMISTIDPELAKAIMVKNFDSFSEIIDWGYPDHKITLDLSGGEQWKALRKVLSPTFTSGKLKAMLEPMHAVVDNLIKHIEKEIEKNPVLAVKGMFQSFALDTISACAFGIDTNSFENTHNDILEWGKKLFTGFATNNWIEDGFFNLLSHFTYLNRYIDIYPPEFGKLFRVTREIIEERKKKNIVKDDFIGRLTEIIEKPEAPLTPDLITAQGVIFFAAGFETTANTLSTLSFNLAKHPDIQDKIYEEIQETTESCGGMIDHDTITQMHYLEAAIMENLRLNGPANDNFRLCSKDVEIEGIKFKKGTRVMLPTYPLHHSEEYFPEPEKFRPERFLKENAGDIVPFTFRAFGGGNRECIGKRFAMNELKLCLAKILHKFRIEDTPETELNFKNGSFFMMTFDDVKVRFVPREH